MKEKYSIIDGELYYKDPSSKRAALRNNRKVAKMMDVFDIIYEKHFGSLAQRGSSAVWNSLKETWWNTTCGRARR